jgi:hypothetical protein
VKPEETVLPATGTPPVPRDQPPVALLWDQSLVWGLICRATLQELGIPFRLIRAQAIARGQLEAYRILLAPGGWASHKMRVLGQTGQEQVRRFVARGGSYLGFCGGAGLALSSPPSLGLVPLERLPLGQRLPNASGQVIIGKRTEHPMWRNLPASLPVSVWWPSQFKWQPAPHLRVLASYETPGPDFRVADVPLADLDTQEISWNDWEKVYGINLNPRLLMGQPAIIEGRFGRGRVLLSYPHLETPGDVAGNQLFANILRALDQAAAKCCPDASGAAPRKPERPGSPSQDALDQLHQATQQVNSLIRFCERHLFWNWRRPWLLHWRRGIRGLEYGTLAVLLRVLSEEAQQVAATQAATANDPWLAPARRLAQEVRTFCESARSLLLEEKLASQSGQVSKVGQVNASVDRLREMLFGREMNHGGLCRSLFDQLDGLLYQVFTLTDQPDRNSGEDATA